MYHRLLTSSLCAVTVLVSSPVFAQAPTPAPPPPAKTNPAPAIRRWLDVQSVLAAARFRFSENSADRTTVSDLQWQTQFRGRFLFDRGGRYSIGSFVTTGPTFRSGWNYSGAGLNREAHPLKVRHLYFGAAPRKSFEVQVGGLAINRGELSDVIASDNDSFFIGERATVRPARGPIAQISAAAGHFDAVREPDFFTQLKDADHINYGQALVGFKLGSRATASVDYTYEAGRDILREGIALRVPSSAKVLTLVRLESYQRVDPDTAQGFNAAADLKFDKLTATVGVMSTDRNYGPFNGDRWELGSHVYYSITYPLTSSLALNLYHTRAFDIDFPITLKQRFDFVATYNPTAYLKRKGLF
jgi:hypothetical protein